MKNSLSTNGQSWSRAYRLGVQALCGFAVLLVTPAWSHHSFAMFEPSKTLALQGEVKEFQWTNPHAWLQIMAPNDKGQIVEWSLELGSPNTLSRQGLKKNSFKPGDKITIEMRPMRDGSFGGMLTKANLSDGTSLSFNQGGLASQ